MPELCTVGGCSKQRKAKGLCSTHYNQTLPNRHRKTQHRCDECGNPAAKEARARRYQRSYCSMECRDRARKTSTHLSHSQLEPHRSRPLWHTAHRAYSSPKHKAARVWISAACIICGRSFLDLFGSKACSAECQRLHHRAVAKESEHRRRARKVAAFVAPVYRHRIYERDNYTCQLCLQPMAMDEVAPHPRSPSIDHILALANGGTHEPANVQAACWLCNAIKGDREWTTAA